MRFFTVFLGLIALLGSCSTYSDEQIGNFDKEIREYLKKEQIECTASPSGLYYRIDEPGKGPAILFTSIVRFKYKGTFLNGKIFDEQTEPVEYRVDELIGAWKEVMLELKEGGKVFLVTPPQLAYGDHELDDIPANSILVFELEVVEVK